MTNHNLFRIFYFIFRIFIAWCLVACVLYLYIPAYALSLSDAQQDYLVGEYEDAISKAQGLKEDDQLLYFLGLVYMKIANYTQSRTYFHKLLTRFPQSSLSHKAMFKVGDTYFLEKNYEAAKRIYQELEKDRSAADLLSTVYLRLAQIASRKGDWDTQQKYITLIKEKFPTSNEINFVKTLESYGTFFTIQVGAFADKKNALVLKEELSKKYEPYLVEEQQANYPIYKVRIGKYKSRYEVEKIASQLRKEGYPVKIFP